MRGTSFSDYPGDYNSVVSTVVTSNPDTLAVLVSGGLDSAVLLAESIRARSTVIPIYIRTGLYWEPVEYDHLSRFLLDVASPALRPLRVLELPVADVYGLHWSITGVGVPDAATPDEAVFLPGRNVLLLSKALLWCHLNGIPELATAPLGENPFPDATPEFYDGFAGVVDVALGGKVRVTRPYAGLHKADVVRRGKDFPLGLTFSCIRPVRGLHCGECNKCAERRRGFVEAEVPDPTHYAKA